MRKRFLLLSMLAFACACDNSIKPAAEEDPSALEDGGSQSGAEDDGQEDGGRAPARPGEAVEAIVDASSSERWTFFDFEAGKTVGEDSETWDLTLQRFNIKVNGGISGDGGVTVAVFKESFADVTADSAAEFLSDAEDGDDDDSAPDYVFSSGETGWYDYDPTNHKLTPRAHVYVVKTVEGGLFKVEFTNYYNDAGSSGYPALRFESLAAPDHS